MCCCNFRASSSTNFNRSFYTDQRASAIQIDSISAASPAVLSSEPKANNTFRFLVVQSRRSTSVQVRHRTAASKLVLPPGSHLGHVETCVPTGRPKIPPASPAARLRSTQRRTGSTLRPPPSERSRKLAEPPRLRERDRPRASRARARDTPRDSPSGWSVWCARARGIGWAGRQGKGPGGQSCGAGGAPRAGHRGPACRAACARASCANGVGAYIRTWPAPGWDKADDGSITTDRFVARMHGATRAVTQQPGPLLRVLAKNRMRTPVAVCTLRGLGVVG